ncbi:MAG: ABC transporter permease [Elusimicrobia bacterium]|nr:ABC transporter permease [Elusimicrobiota bacterium]
MTFEFSVALRYLNAKKKGLFALLTTIIAIAGVSIGVATLITAMAVISGFETTIKEKILGSQSHIMVFGYMTEEIYKEKLAAILALPQVKAASADIYGQAIITKSGSSSGVMLRGVNPETEKNVSNIMDSFVQGSFENTVGGAPPLVVGYGLAEKLNLKVGDDVVLISPTSVKTSAGSIPKMKKFKVTGIIKTGYYQFDYTVGYTDLAAASDFLNMQGGVNSIGVKLNNLNDLGVVVDKMRGFLNGYAVRTYAQINSTFYASLKLQKVVMFIILSLIILVAALNIASNLILLGKEKLKEIGIMRAMGAAPKSISRIFLWEGMMICTAGILLGTLLAFALCWVISSFNLINLPQDMYMLSRVPVDISARDVLSVIAGSYILCFATALYPAFRAGKVKPIDAIRYG